MKLLYALGLGALVGVLLYAMATMPRARQVVMTVLSPEPVEASTGNGTGSERFCARHCGTGNYTSTTLDPPGDTTTTTLPACGPGQCPDSCAFSCVDEVTGTCNPNCTTSRESAVYFQRLLLAIHRAELACGRHPFYHPCKMVKASTKYPDGLKCPHPGAPHRVLVPIKGTAQ
jgi:hypothetical protein